MFVSEESFMLSSGAVLQGRYHILRHIGGGGMGDVYLAEDRRLPGRYCALKEMSPAALPAFERGWVINAFQQEAQMLAVLRHPGLTPVTDYFTEAGNWYLVMEHIEGVTLENHLQRTPGQRLPLAAALRVAEQLCDVLDYLHRQSPPIIFRDLKPGNIMLTPHGDVKLIDFGIARFFKLGQSQDTVNLGTPGYCAPEQFNRGGQTDARTDVYSLGVVLHQLLTGYDPTTSAFRLPLIRSLDLSLPVAIESVINQATQLDPALRFQSILEFKQALFLVAPTLNLTAPLWRKRSSTIGAVVLIVLIVAVALVARSISPQPPTPTATPVTTLPATITPTPQPVATETRLPTATVVLSPTPDNGYKLIEVLAGEGLNGVIFRACPGLKLDDLPNYTLRVRKANPELPNDLRPEIYPGQELRMPPCP
jgi:serine/threonine protein kinase